MKTPQWSLFFDFHTMADCPDVGKNFDAVRLVSEIKKIGADFIVFPARCNQGFAYYDTKIGIKHPSMKRDLLGELTAACAAEKIAISAYINVGLSHEEAYRRREWSVLGVDGRILGENRVSPYSRQMCYNTGYGDHVTEMVREVASRYPVAGFFLDCLQNPPCLGRECVQEMKALGMDWNDANQQAQFAVMTRKRIARRIADAAKKFIAEPLLYFNGLDFEDQLDIGTYLELECLPSSCGYEVLPVGCRYMRTLGKPLVNMTGRFQKTWGDFGGLRPDASLEYDCLYGLANGMPPNIGDHYHPRGDFNPAAFALYKRIYSRLKPLEPWTRDAKPQTEIAIAARHVVYSFRQEALTSEKPELEQQFGRIKATTRALRELNQQFDILSDVSDWGGYKVLVLPDHVRLTPDMAEKVARHLDAGGSVIASALSGLRSDADAFALEDAWGVKYLGASPYDPAYYRPASKIAEGLPDMPMTLYERGVRVSPAEGTETLAEIVAPFFSRHWDGEHGFAYLPPDKPTGEVAATRKGNVIYLTHPIFDIYHRHAPTQIRRLFANLLNLVLPEPMLRMERFPSFGSATVTARENQRMVHLLSYVPERRGVSSDMIEEPIALRDVVVRLRVDGRFPREVYLAPSRTALPFTREGDYVRVVVPEMDGYALVVFEA